MPTVGSRRPLVLAVGGGKGGVGKSVVTTNLGLAAARLGARTVLVDADFGSANLHTMLGIDHATPTLRRFLDGEVSTLHEILVATGYPRVELLRGCVATPGAANLIHARKLKFIRHLATLDADLVIVDCGAGIHFNVVDMFTAADVRLLVACPQLVSVQNAYGFLKAAVHRYLGHDLGVADGPRATGSFEPAEVEVLPRRIRSIEVEDAQRAGALRARLSTFEVGLFGNQLGSDRELAVIRALSKMAHDFLDISVDVVGGMARLDYIHDSVTRRRPFVVDAPASHESLMLTDIAESLLERGRLVARPSAAPRIPSIRPRSSTPDLGTRSM